MPKYGPTAGVSTLVSESRTMEDSTDAGVTSRAPAHRRTPELAKIVCNMCQYTASFPSEEGISDMVDHVETHESTKRRHLLITRMNDAIEQMERLLKLIDDPGYNGLADALDELAEIEDERGLTYAANSLASQLYEDGAATPPSTIIGFVEALKRSRI